MKHTLDYFIYQLLDRIIRRYNLYKRNQKISALTYFGTGSQVGDMFRANGIGQISVGEQCRISAKLICHHDDAKISIGNRCFMGPNSVIESARRVVLGDDVLVARDVMIIDNNSHSLDWKTRKNEADSGRTWDSVDISPVIIGASCWIGAKAIILKGVSLGDGCIVGAGSVVTKSFPAYSLLVGNPARVIESLK